MANINLVSPYCVTCGIKEDTVHPLTYKYPNTITPEDIKNIYEPMGFLHFKLEGRSLEDAEVLANYARYLIKPEYQLNFISNFFK